LLITARRIKIRINKREESGVDILFFVLNSCNKDKDKEQGKRITRIE